MSAEPQSKPYPRTCPECGAVAVQPKEIAYDAQIKHDGQTHRVRIPRLVVDKCQRCGEEFFTNRTNDQITAGLREFLSLLQPEEIRRRLAELQLSERSLAERIGVGPETVSRVLNGLSIQNRSLDDRMRLVLDLASSDRSAATCLSTKPDQQQRRDGGTQVAHMFVQPSAEPT